MATKTYAQLTAETTVEDADLLATYRGSAGPLKRLTALLFKNYVRTTPSLVPVSAKTTGYTIVAADVGTLFECSGTFTLTLTAASTLATGFSFGVRNTGTGVITVDPSGSDLIDGRASILVYPGEGFIVDCNGTAFLTVGRAKTVVCYSNTLSVAVSDMEISQGLNDTEFVSFQINVAMLGTSTGAKPRMGVRSGGVYSIVCNWANTINTAGTLTGNSGSAVSYIEIGQHNRVTGGIIQLAQARNTVNSRGPFLTYSMLEQDVQRTTQGTASAIITSGVDGVIFLYSAGNIGVGSTFMVIGQRGF